MVQTVLTQEEGLHVYTFIHAIVRMLILKNPHPRICFPLVLRREWKGEKEELFAVRGCDFAFGFPSSRRGLANDSGTMNS